MVTPSGLIGKQCPLYQLDGNDKKGRIEDNFKPFFAAKHEHCFAGNALLFCFGAFVLFVKANYV